MTYVHGSVGGGWHTYTTAHVPSTYQKPACRSLDPEKWRTTYVPHTSKLHGREIGRLGFTMVSVPQNQSSYSLVRSLLLANRNPPS